MTDIDTSKEAVEALLWDASMGECQPGDVYGMCKALMAERDTLQAQLNSATHAAKVLLGDMYAQDALVHWAGDKVIAALKCISKG